MSKPRLKERGKSVLRRRRVLCCVGSCLLGAAFADEPAPVKVSISSELTLTGNSFVHLENHETNSMILEVSPGPLSSLQFRSQRVTLNPGAIVKMNLGNLHFPPGRQRLHIISKCFDPQNAPAGMGPFLLESLMVTATEIRKISDEDASLSQRKAVPDASQPESPKGALGPADNRPVGGLAYRTVPIDLPLSASPTSLRITTGNRADYAVEIGASSGFDADVRLSVSGLPQGTTARFTPNPATRKSILTVEVTKNARPGRYLLTVSGVSGSVMLSATVTLFIP